MNIAEKLIDKSKEAFLMSIEIYNKPSIKYRVEGFSFFICNAWELMLKAYMIKKFGMASIYYKDHKTRTLSLENCIKKVFTNEKSPIRKNLSKIIELRNTSTHFITEEYEMVYVPLFQACVFNYTEKMLEFHDVDITEIIPNNFLTLSVKLNIFDANDIRAKYPAQIAEKIISQQDNLANMISENNDSFAIKIEHNYYITKDKNKASAFVRIDNAAEQGVRIIKEMKDPNDTHQYAAKKCIDRINNMLVNEGLNVKINHSNFQDFCKTFGIKDNSKLCYIDKHYEQYRYSYSQLAIDFIVGEIRKDPENILLKIRNKNKYTKK